jgi:hypothetical protein
MKSGLYLPLVKVDAFVEFFHDGVSTTLEPSASTKEASSGTRQSAFLYIHTERPEREQDKGHHRNKNRERRSNASEASKDRCVFLIYKKYINEERNKCAKNFFLLSLLIVHFLDANKHTNPYL